MPSTAKGVAVVTGGSAGLGRAIVRELAKDGWDVAILSRDEDRLKGAKSDVEQAGRRATYVSVDVSDAKAVDEAADQVERELGPIDLWINDAMTSVFAKFIDIDADEFDRATRVTYLGFVNGTRAAVKRMVPRDKGHIIQVGSALAYRGIPLQSAYCGAKHAMVGMTESLRTELLHDKSNVTLSMVHMPALNTPQFSWVRNKLPKHPQPVPPIFQPEVGARAVVHVANHPRRSTWVGLPTVATIIGNRVAGGLLDHYLARTGFKSQQTSGPGLTTLGDNFFTPVDGDPGAHGDFDGKAKPKSLQTEIAVRRTPGRTAAAVGGLVAATAAIIAKKSR